MPRHVALGALLLVAALAHAQPYPSKPIALIVPYPPGGGSDFFAHTVGPKMAETLGQPFVLVAQNRPGSALGGVRAAAKAAPDGYTVLLGDSAAYAINPSLYKNLPYDPVKDFAPVSLTGRFALLLVVNPSVLAAKSPKDLVARAKQRPGAIAYGSPGSGTPHHLAMELFEQRASIRLRHVPYKGGAAPAVEDLLGGRIATMFLDLAAAAPLLKGGKVKALAVASPKRIPAFPDVPTLAESGFPGFEAWAWQGFAVPAGTPKEIIARLNSAYAKAIADPEVRQKVSDGGIEPLSGTPQEMADYIRSETAKWAKLIADRHITVD